ncbi:glycerophosphodiester phosphodiesterase family protein [Phenylobacterium sp.]|jgi:glycerophosphoryl diester phosphodiesterase|uniref:glycerophosphodiester phosphodiesterase family protein n=1 Tax=Phenylobacterium sp. TaxID=1871053 RepID=UPI000C94C6CC|nr:glycerophosphodiester phosphodiesterase family protein [Phenylobacterium sp.]MAK82148.1 glycerophosphodiester phosphodiesterase [Phenylobacterium sp.]|tara:strand:+ start:80582 stop:81619 length:1038 start_codon:yes stop_codon:yes gene_type:complete
MSALTRRAFTASAPLALAAFARPGVAQPSRTRPLVIAHRGASGERPEHTLAAYQRAIDQGADFIEPDLVMTRDGVLVARHENEISGTTDVADRPDFADRRTERLIDGVKAAGWFTEDFTLAELKTLRARERLPDLRPASAAFDGQQTIPTFQEVVDLADAESRRTGRTIGTYPEMKHPTYFEARGLPMGTSLAAALRDNGLDQRDAPVFVQCFEPKPLRAFRGISAAPTVMLVGAGRLSDSLLAEVAEFADGLGPELRMVLDVAAPGLPATGLIARAQAAGMKVHPWTVRSENSFLPAALRQGEDPAGHGDAASLLRAVFGAGADGVFTDFPELAVKVRQEMFGA